MRLIMNNKADKAIRTQQHRRWTRLWYFIASVDRGVCSGWNKWALQNLQTPSLSEENTFSNWTSSWCKRQHAGLRRFDFIASYFSYYIDLKI